MEEDRWYDLNLILRRKSPFVKHEVDTKENQLVRKIEENISKIKYKYISSES